MSDVSLYLNFVLHAVLGRLADADWIMCEHGDAVRRMAAALLARYPFAAKPLHRGLAFDGAFDPAGRYFTSWSESADVATWFADPRSVMNEELRKAHPTATGYTLTVGAPERVLFHHSWARLENWPALALMHPHMGPEGARQIAWSLSTQREVITDPPTSWPVLQPLGRAHSIEALDRELGPPWLDENASPTGQELLA